MKNCPNCGAPIINSFNYNCPYCNTYIIVTNNEDNKQMIGVKFVEVDEWTYDHVILIKIGAYFLKNNSEILEEKFHFPIPENIFYKKIRLF